MAASAAAKQLGIHPRTAYRWVSQYNACPDSIFESCKKVGRKCILTEEHRMTKSVDIHRDVSVSMGSSLPPVASIYCDIWPCIQDTRDGRKLVIASLSSTSLITSSIRVDILEDPKIGPSSSTVTISPQTSKIYIDQESWNKANALALNSEARSNHTSYLTGQMRQLRSQFHHPTSYMLCRASSHVAIGRFCQKLTVFTYADFVGIK